MPPGCPRVAGCRLPYGERVAALLLVAVALGLSNLAAAIGIGVSGVDGAVRLRVALVFGLFEAGMPLVGLAIGHAVSADADGPAFRWMAGGLLAVVGCYEVTGWLRSRREDAPGKAAPGKAAPGEAASGEAASAGAAPGEAAGSKWGGWRLVVSGLTLSIDNLIVGFALGADRMALLTATVVIGLVSVGMSLAGLELGAKLGMALGERAELAGGIVLVLVGALVAAGAF